MTAVRKLKAHKGPWEIWGNFRGRKLCVCGPMKKLLSNTKIICVFMHLPTLPHRDSWNHIRIIRAPYQFLKQLNLKPAVQNNKKSFRHHWKLLTGNKAFVQCEEGKETEEKGEEKLGYGGVWELMYRYLHGCKITKSCGMLQIRKRPVPQELVLPARTPLL